ncbi:MAG: response regulator [Magnetococcales bacterium]|nr:response regulator [Magnetococcales bacterium]
MHSKAKILIIDDDQDFRRNFLEILVRSGFLAEEAASGVEALPMLQTGKYDIVMLDLMMPKMDGLETLREIKRLGLKSKIVMITAFSTVQNAVEAIKQGASDYISKPFKVEELIAIINRTLEEARFEQAIQIGDLTKTLGSLANPIRQKIMVLLGTRGSMRLMEIRQSLYIEDHTKIVFHLKVLTESGLVEKQLNRSYELSPSGQEVLVFLQSLQTRLHQQT